MALTWPATYQVVNVSRRTRIRNGVLFPPQRGEEQHPVTVEVSTQAEYLRLAATRSLQLTPVNAPQSAEDTESGVMLPPPPGNASQAAWAAYAVSVGMDPAQAQAMTRNQLIAAVGQPG